MIDTNKARELAKRLSKHPIYTRTTKSGRSVEVRDIPDAAALLLQLSDAHDRMAKDAARYRHAVENAYVWGSVNTYSTHQDEPVAFWIKSNVPMDKAGIDEQIDAAMGADNG